MSKWRYRTYRFASEKATNAIVDEYNERTDEPTDAASVHATLSALCLTQEHYGCCYVEADMLSQYEGQHARAASLAFKTLALYGMDLPQLARDRYDELKALLAETSDMTPEEVQLRDKLFLTSLVLVALHQGDAELATRGAEALGATSQVDYLPPLVSAIAKAKEGDLLDTREELAELARSEKFRGHTRALLKEVSAIAEQADDSEQFLSEISERLPALLAERVINDIFAEEKRAALLEQIKQIPESHPVAGEAAER
jgi:hypothetical protein